MLFSGKKKVRIVWSLFLYKGSSEEGTKQESAPSSSLSLLRICPLAFVGFFWAALSNKCWMLRHPPGAVLSNLCPWCAQRHPQHPAPDSLQGLKHPVNQQNTLRAGRSSQENAEQSLPSPQVEPAQCSGTVPSHEQSLCRFLPHQSEFIPPQSALFIPLLKSQNTSSATLLLGVTLLKHCPCAPD